MLRFMIRFTLLVVALPGPALAVEDGAVTLSPYIGAALWEADNDLEDDIVFGARLGYFPRNWLGLEGTWGFSPTDLTSSPDDQVWVNHVGTDLVVRFLPNERVVPYGIVGWSQLFVKPSKASTTGQYNGWEFGGGLDIGLSDRVSLRLDARDVAALFDPPKPTPNEMTHNFLITAGFSFAFGGAKRDADLDGVADKKDECPGTPAGAMVNALGCPLDSDGDGVFDGLDQCGGTPVGAIVDASGCPSDADSDGVFDGLDRCPGTPGGATIDADGCPSDTDGDGIFDGLDKCPDGPQGAIVDAGGCPKDSDADGVFDGLDVCPGTPFDTPVDKRGCPIPQSKEEEELLDTGTLRLNSVYFESASAALKPASFASLDAVAEILARWPQLKIEVGGHTDSQGAEAFNATLSEKRAQSVLDYVTTRAPSIQVGQFTVKGYGESEPIADNATSDGRAQNRRVVFKVLNPGVLRR